jgi:hypothetical protein
MYSFWKIESEERDVNHESDLNQFNTQLTFDRSSGRTKGSFDKNKYIQSQVKAPQLLIATETASPATMNRSPTSNRNQKPRLLVDYREKPATVIGIHNENIGKRVAYNNFESLNTIPSRKQDIEDESIHLDSIIEEEASSALVSFQLRRSFKDRDTLVKFHQSDSAMECIRRKSHNQPQSDSSSRRSSQGWINLQEHFDKTSRRENLRKGKCSSKSVQSLGLDSSPLPQSVLDEPISTQLRRKSFGANFNSCLTKSPPAPSNSLPRYRLIKEDSDPHMSYLPTSLQPDCGDRRSMMQRETSFVTGSRIRRFFL